MNARIPIQDGFFRVVPHLSSEKSGSQERDCQGMRPPVGRQNSSDGASPPGLNEAEIRFGS